MKNSPFIYGNTVSNDSFTNRVSEIRKLKNNLLSGINTTIISPRRWGKSSLVEKVINEIKAEDKYNNYKIILIDLFSIGNEEEFLEVFASETIKSTSTKWEDWTKNTKEFIKKIIPEIHIGMAPYNDFRIGFNWNDLKNNNIDILNLPEIIAKKNKQVI